MSTVLVVIISLLGLYAPVDHSRFVVEDRVEGCLLTRYLDLRHKDIALKIGSIVVFYCGHGERDGILDDFARSYGVDLRRKDKAGNIARPFPIVSVDIPDGETIAHFEAQFAPNSKVIWALKVLEGAHRVSPGDRVLECSYWVRPWISSNLQRSEEVEGAITVNSRSGRTTVPFFSGD